MTELQLSTDKVARHALPSGLIHELRTPLNLIIGYTEMLMEQAQEQGREDFVSDLQKTYGAGQQLLALINDHFHPIGPLDDSADLTKPREEPPTPAQRVPTAETILESRTAAEPASGAPLGFLLVVDDLQADLDVLSRQLERQGYVVATASSGQQALEMMQANIFDLLLLDIVMPEMDGYQVLQRLKADEVMRHIPVIIISALSELDSVVRCIEMGAEDYLTKPFNSILLKARIGACLQKKRAQQTERELEAARQLLETSRQAGTAEIATSVLHNVGNVLNSVNVSGGVILDKINKSKLMGLTRAVALMEAHKSDLSGFLNEDVKGKQLLGYLAKLDLHLAHEQKEILQEINILVGNINHIKEIVSTQQSFARGSGGMEILDMKDLVEDALRINSGALERHKIELVREYSAMEPVLVDKHKVLQILVNLIRNAKHAFDDSAENKKQISLRITNAGDRMKISVVDNGVGIPAENLRRIFNHGFTTKKEGHGFGLHSGALTAKELGGTLTAFSEGTERGSCFTLELPVSGNQ